MSKVINLQSKDLLSIQEARELAMKARQAQ